MAWNTRSTYATTDPPVVLADTLQAIADDIRTNGGDRDYGGYGANNMGYFRLTARALPTSPTTGMIVTDSADGITKQWTGTAWRTFASGYTPLFIVAAGAPASGTGNNGDLYINSTTGDVYGPKASGAWGSIVANIRGATGATGATGPAGSNASAANWRGAYASGTTYAQGDGVTYSGSAYVSLQASNTGNTPSTSPTYWQSIGTAGLGDPGSNGIIKRTASNTTAVATASDVVGVFSGTPTGAKYLRDDGTLATPSGSSRISSRATNSSVQALATGSFTALTWDTNVSDSGGVHSTSSNPTRFTVPTGEDGDYILIGQVSFAFNATNGTRGCYWRKNGTTFVGEAAVPPVSAGSLPTRVCAPAMIYAAAGDYFELLAYQDSGGSINTVAADTYASVCKVR